MVVVLLAMVVTDLAFVCEGETPVIEMVRVVLSAGVVLTTLVVELVGVVLVAGLVLKILVVELVGVVLSVVLTVLVAEVVGVVLSAEVVVPRPVVAMHVWARMCLCD